MLIDAHNHLYDRRLVPHLPAVAAAARLAGVKWMVVNGTCERDWPLVAALARDLPEVVPSFGLHPCRVMLTSPDWRTALLRHLDSMPSAMGEIGLDRRIEPRDEAAQGEAFGWQMDVARERNLPVAVHCVQAWGWLDKMLGAHPPPTRGYMLHAFGGSVESLRAHVRRGAYISIAANVALERKAALREALREVPADRLLLETDSPDILPPEHLGCDILFDEDGEPLGQPANLRQIAAYVASIRGEDPEALIAQVAANARRFFHPLMG